MLAADVRVGDLTVVDGVRENQLVGYGVVVGLAGTGDRRQTVFSAQSLANLLLRMGVQVNPAQLRVNNTAAVLLTATLPAFAKPGARIDVTAASAGDASSLAGGLLLMTPLRAADGRTYAVAQGPLVTGGFSAGRGGNSQSVNHPTVGRIAAGALVEREAPAPASTGPLRLHLRRADATTASRIADAINRGAGEPVAAAETPGDISVTEPSAWRGRPVEWLSHVQNLRVSAAAPNRVVINERTGTLVLGREIRIAPVTILHGALSVEIRTTFDVSQPAPLSQGQTAVVPQTSVAAREEKARSIVLQEGALVDDLVRGLNSMGATPRDVIAILQNLRAAGSLDADIEVI